MSKAPTRPSNSVVSAKREVQGTARRDERAPMSQAETARYIAEFTAELSYLARQADLDLLAYLLDMARIEASQTK